MADIIVPKVFATVSIQIGDSGTPMQVAQIDLQIAMSVSTDGNGVTITVNQDAVTAKMAAIVAALGNIDGDMSVPLTVDAVTTKGE